MKRLLMAMTVIMFSWSVHAAEKFESEEYKIGSGDILFISVWKDDALTKQCVVLPDGKIHFPLIGQIVAEGKTVEELKREMHDKIHQFIPDPILHVEVQQVASLMIYVIGRVNNPGRHMIGSNINVLQALAIAGGLNPFAEEDEIKIFRERNGETFIYHFDYCEVSEGVNIDQNICLERGDVVIVP